MAQQLIYSYINNPDEFINEVIRVYFDTDTKVVSTLVEPYTSQAVSLKPEEGQQVYAVCDTTPGSYTKDVVIYSVNQFQYTPEQNSVDCGYTEEPEYPADGTFIKNDCYGLDLYQVVADGSGGERQGTLVEANSTTCGYEPPEEEEPEPILGCMDPEASNYNPEATEDNGTCVFPIRMTATLPALITVAGNPIEVELQSAATNTEAAQASVLITLGTLDAESRLTLNGSVFRYSLTPSADEFFNGATLAQALADEELIALQYTISQPAANQVKLTSLQTGSRHTPEVTATNDITLAITAGKDALRSQSKSQWGCYVELWGCAGTLGGAADKDTSKMIGRLERLRTPQNSYTFDLSQMLVRGLGHSLFTENDRLQAYFVRYGEIYAQTGQAHRRRYPLGESEVLWALEGALPLTTPNQLATPLLLSTLPAMTSLPLHGLFSAEALYVLAAAGTGLSLSADFRFYDGTIAREVVHTIPSVTGGVQKFPLGPLLARAKQLNLEKKTVSCKWTLSASRGTASTVLATRELMFSDQSADQRCLMFASSLGAYESAWFTGVPETAAKRSADTFQRSFAGLATSSTRTRMVRMVELDQTMVVNSSLLDKATFLWLCTELATSPDVFLFDPQTGVYTAVNIREFDSKADEVEQEYYLSLTLEKGIPHNPLKN